jgi:hypothetical protein
VSQNAAEFLREDGVQNTANVTAWLSSQDRLEAGRPLALPWLYEGLPHPWDVIHPCATRPSHSMLSED